MEKALDGARGARSFLNELVWREFTHSTLWDRPELLEQPFRRQFTGFPWENNRALWDAWVEGRTGYPVVDASARQLLGEGFVHNRARMISASFLTKHLLIDYRRGEAHYMKFLTDGDWAQNNAGWQWSAGCGCDAQPYFPRLQPGDAGRQVRPRGGLRAPLGSRARGHARPIHTPPVGGARIGASRRPSTARERLSPAGHRPPLRARALPVARRAPLQERSVAGETMSGGTSVRAILRPPWGCSSVWESA
ncbi:MAG TPA: FAD-binding domain-containing protein [Thermoanaerobaculia bacterium]|nr:FAD-binding domain-containing protein [Thermoanaerobaculia bacterium]